MDNLILVTWCERTNIAGIGYTLHACGAFGAQMDANPQRVGRQTFENPVIRDSIVKPLLIDLRADASGQSPLPNISRVADVQQRKAAFFRMQVERAFAMQGHREGPAFFASHLNCLIWPIWEAAFPDAKWIIVRRADEGIIAGCVKSGFMDRLKTAEQWRRDYLGVYKERFAQIVTRGLPVWQIWPEQLQGDQPAAIKEMVDWLGLEWQESARDVLPVGGRPWHG